MDRRRPGDLRQLGSAAGHRRGAVVWHAVPSLVSPPGLDPTGALADDALRLHDPGPGDSGAVGRPRLAGAGGTGTALPPRRTVIQHERLSYSGGIMARGGERSKRTVACKA